MGTVIAHLHVADVVTELPCPMSETPPKTDVSLLDFGDSHIPRMERVTPTEHVLQHVRN